MIQENFIRLYEDAFRKNWELPGFTDYGENHTMTYEQIAVGIAKLHLLFDQCDVKKNEKIALCGKNNSQWAMVYLGAVTYGAIIVPILQDFNPNDIHHVVNHSESKLLFVSDSIWENLEEDNFITLQAVFSLTDYHPVVLLNQPTATLLEESESGDKIVAPIQKAKLSKRHIEDLFAHKYPYGFSKDSVRYVDKPNSELVSINYTSGTTGFSKGVMTSGNALAGNVTFAVGTGLIAPGFNIVAF